MEVAGKLSRPKSTVAARMIDSRGVPCAVAYVTIPPSDVALS
jgi:hypothetical protein